MKRRKIRKDPTGYYLEEAGCNQTKRAMKSPKRKRGSC